MLGDGPGVDRGGSRALAVTVEYLTARWMAGPGCSCPPGLWVRVAAGGSGGDAERARVCRPGDIRLEFAPEALQPPWPCLRSAHSPNHDARPAITRRDQRPRWGCPPRHHPHGRRLTS